MGSDDFFKKKRQAKRQRKYAYKEPKTDSYLIVTEGEKTEPSYLNGLKAYILGSLDGSIDIVPAIDVSGQGMNTVSLVHRTAQLRRDSNIMYQHVWVVMDKDDFIHFDEAVKIAESQEIHVAWSNQCFEYWLYLHFHYSDVALHRDDWKAKLNLLLKKYDIGDGSYHKNDVNLYDIFNTYPGDVYVAIANAKRRMADFNTNHHKPSVYNPGTTVHILVEQLLEYIK